MQSADGLGRLVAGAAQHVAEPACSTADPFRSRLALPSMRRRARPSLRSNWVTSSASISSRPVAHGR